MPKRVAVVGLSFRFPGTDTAGYWSALMGGRDLVTEVDGERWAKDAYLHPDKSHPGTAYTFAAGSIGDISGFDAAFFGISPREAALMDPQQRLLLELCWEAIEHAGIPPSNLRGSDTGVYIGIASADYAYRLADDLDAIDSSFATGNTASIAANRLSYAFDLRGPSMAVDTACSSSLVAFHQACQAIESGEVSHAIAGGVSLHLHPYGFITFSKASMLSKRGRCNVFDADGDGYVRSEGGGLFLLKDYDAAVAAGDRILGVIAHTAVNTDGRKSGLTVPSADAQIALMTKSYDQAGIMPEQIDYLEAHGTGTAVGDPIETRAIGLALAQKRERPLPIGSVKSNMGHLEAASGVAGLVKALYCLAYREVPATIGIQTLNPLIKFDEWNLDVVSQNRKLKDKGTLTVGVNSFGFGGANAHVILQSHEPSRPGAQTLLTPHGVPVVVTAKTAEALMAQAQAFAATLRDQPPSALYDIAYQAAFRREWHEHRAMVFGNSPRAIAEDLDALGTGESVRTTMTTAMAVPQACGAALVYSGNGSQWLGMGRALLADPVFAAAVAEIDASFAPLAGYRLTDDLSGALDAGQAQRYQRTEFAQPALFAVQVGVTRMLANVGIEPAAVIGHSVGEVAAAWACGALSLAQATQVIFHRSRLQGSTRGNGAMTAVGLSGAASSALLEQLGLSSTVSVAGHNSSRGATLAGHPDDLSTVEQHLSAQRIFQKRLDLDYAFHSPAMTPIEQPLRAALADLNPAPSRIPFYSAVSGDRIEGTELDADYWWRNIRERVGFEEAMAAMVRDGINIYAEIGPHPVLKSYVSDALKIQSIAGRALVTGQRGDDSPEKIYATSAQLVLSGATTDWRRFFPVVGAHATLPAYSWQRERHWHSITTQAGRGLLRERVHPLLGYAAPKQPGVWENHLDTRLVPMLADHVVGHSTVFPGTGFVELALAAAFAHNGGAFAEIEDIDIRTPLLLGNDETKVVQTRIDDSDGAVSIHALTLGSDDPYALHAVGRIMAEPRGVGLSDPAIEWPTRTPDFTGADHAALTDLVGLSYGPAFCAIADGWRESDRVVLARFKPDACIAKELPQTHIHPALLDCAFQLIIQLLKDDPAMHTGAAFVPAKIGRVIVRANGGTPAVARVTLLRRTPHALVARFALFDSDGIQIAAIEEARFRSIRLQKTAAEHLAFPDYFAAPAPHADTVSINRCAPASEFAAALDALATDRHHDPAAQRFATEVDPLVDALCSQFIHEALRALANEAGVLSSGCVQGLRHTQPERAVLLNTLIDRLVGDGVLTPSASGWTFTGTDAPPAIDIWNSLVREYPDHFAIVQTMGRVGQHLTALIKGERAWEDTWPREATPAKLAAHVQGIATRQDMAHAIGAHALAAQTRLLAGERLAILELGGAAPLLGPECCAQLDPLLTDYCYGSADPDALAEARRSFDPFPDVRIVDLTVQDHAPVVRYAIAFIDISLMALDEARHALRYARDRMLPEGTLLVLNTHPAGWLDVIFGGLHDWWVGESHTTVASRQQPAAFWEAELAALDLLPDAACMMTPDHLAGAYLLVSHRPAAAADVARPVVSTASTDAPLWMLITERSDSSAQSTTVGRALHADFIAAGHRVQWITVTDKDIAATADNPTDTDPIFHALHGCIAQFGPLHGIVHLHGLHASQDDDAQTLLDRQVQRCDVAARLARACETLQSHAGVWLITSGAQAAITPVGETACRTNHVDEKWVDTADEPSTVSPSGDAALWGFGRTMMNEAAGFSVRLVDLEGTFATDAELLAALARELISPDEDAEVLLSKPAHGIARRVPRMVLTPRPRPVWLAGVPRDPAGDTIRLGFEFPGQLRNLRWESVVSAAPADDEVEIDIHATGLNFRDVMYALGMLSDEAIENGFAGPTLGLEFAGTVRRVGRNIDDYRVGDAVVGFGPSSFGNRMLTKVSAIAHLPTGMSFEAAATIPSTFFTVYYALNYLSRLEPGEKILIHGAAGGVGIAAIQYAQSIGADIYATAGSNEKRDFLRMMGVTRIYDSRSLAYAEDILRDTDGVGVDVVLNSLAGEAINRNLRVLKPFGRFLELGKRDFYENTRIGLRPFRNNISYFGIDADQLMHARPELTQRLFGEMMALFENGTLHPLPYQLFDANAVVDAFRHMQQSRHIGKIVVTYRNGMRQVHATVDRRLGRRLVLDSTGSYLVTGGLAGFGLRTAQWLVERGARHLILASRSGPASTTAQTALAAFKAQGVTVHAAACDVTDATALQNLLDEAGRRLPPLKGVVHAAVVIDDGLVRGMSASQIRRTLAAKLVGAHHLHRLTAGMDLDLFVLFSSATTLLGNPGQSNYVAANSWLEALAQTRRGAGLAATCVKWGAIDDVGFLADNDKVKDALQNRMGGHALPSSLALRILEDMVLGERSNMGVMELDWRALSRFLPTSGQPKFGPIARRSKHDDDEGQSDDIALWVATLADDALHAKFVEILRHEVGDILRVAPEKIDPTQSIYDMGLDSLMGVELVMALEGRFGVRLPVMALNDSPTLAKLAERLGRMLKGEETAEASEQKAAESRIAKIAQQHDADVSDEQVAELVARLASDNDAQARMIH